MVSKTTCSCGIIPVPGHTKTNNTYGHTVAVFVGFRVLLGGVPMAFRQKMGCHGATHLVVLPIVPWFLHVLRPVRCIRRLSSCPHFAAGAAVGLKGATVAKGASVGVGGSGATVGSLALRCFSEVSQSRWERRMNNQHDQYMNIHEFQAV